MNQTAITSVLLAFFVAGFSARSFSTPSTESLRAMSVTSSTRNSPHSNFIAGLAHAKRSPSFECKNALSSAEKLICADARLAALDVKLSKAYGSKLSLAKNAQRESLIASQKAFIKTTSACTKVECVDANYNQRIAELSAKTFDLKLKPATAKLNLSDVRRDLRLFLHGALQYGTGPESHLECQGKADTASIRLAEAERIDRFTKLDENTESEESVPMKAKKRNLKNEVCTYLRFHDVRCTGTEAANWLVNERGEYVLCGGFKSPDLRYDLGGSSRCDVSQMNRKSNTVVSLLITCDLKCTSQTEDSSCEGSSSYEIGNP